MEAAVEQPVTGLEVFRKDNSLLGIHDENLKDFGEGSSRCTLTEVKSGSGQKRIFPEVSRKDMLFDDGLSFEEVFHSSREIHENHVSRSQISADEKRCRNILGRLQKKEDEYLHLVFHDTMISRVRMSGLGLVAYRRLIFRSWKSYVEEMKISKLRLDGGVQNFCNFLASLSEDEKKIVFPLIRETQQKIDDCRTRKKEIRCEKNWTFRRHLSLESSLVCRRRLFDDWIGGL